MLCVRFQPLSPALATLKPPLSQASGAIVKLQASLAAAHARDQAALKRFVRAAQGAAVMQSTSLKDITQAAAALRQVMCDV